MKKLMICAVYVCSLVLGIARAEVAVPDGFRSEALNQDLGGGFDWLPDGDIIGMYADQGMLENSYIGIIDANGDGTPQGVSRVYDFGKATFGSFVKVSPDGSFALFVDSMSYQIFSISLPDYNVTEVIPPSGSFDGAFDLAFIDNEHCYISANPAWGMTNKIFHLNLNSRALIEVASVDMTFSGPIDVDDSGNLYYVKNKANFPIQKGEFTVLRFEAVKLENTLNGGPVLGEGDAQEMASGLDGGYDVAWHASGAVYVSDANNGKIYKIASVSDFATLGGGAGGGFTILAFRNRDQAFDAGVLTDAALCAGYLDFYGGPTPPNIYRIAPVAPELGIAVDRISYTADDVLSVELSIRRDVPIPFDGYIVFVGPGGLTYSCRGSSVAKGIRPYVTAVPGLRKPYQGTVAMLTIPPATPPGEWTVYAAILRAGDDARVANALAISSSRFTVE